MHVHVCGRGRLLHLFWAISSDASPSIATNSSSSASSEGSSPRFAKLEIGCVRAEASRIAGARHYGDGDEEEIPCIRNRSSKPPSEVDFLHSRFPHCIVWTSLPVVSWLAPLIGHVGICCEDGSILDFSGSCLVNFDNFAFGAPARYIRLDHEQCCFPPHLSGHRCSSGFQHANLGTATSWDDGLRACMHSYQHKSYNLFTCNSHSFVASFLNRIAYRSSIDWTMLSVVVLIFVKGRWVNTWAAFRSWAPFLLVMLFGSCVAGLPFVVGWTIFQVLLVAWFVLLTHFKPRFVEG